MNRAKFIQWLAIGCCLFFLARKVTYSANEPPLSLGFAVTVWTLCIVGLLRNPRKWGLPVGVFSLFAVAVQLGLWRLAVNDGRYEVDERWGNFVVSVLPLVVGGIAGISLRWIHPNPSVEAS